MIQFMQKKPQEGTILLELNAITCKKTCGTECLNCVMDERALEAVSMMGMFLSFVELSILAKGSILLRESMLQSLTKAGN